jgi:PKD repeat protein
MTACGNLTIYPVVDFDAYPLSGNTPLNVQFSNKTIGVDNLTYKWDYYNDGTVDSTSENPSASFTNTTSYPITYSVKLTATNTNNVPVSIVKENYITVNPVQDKITVTSPSSGVTWQRGTKHTIYWSYTGNLGSYVRISLLKAGVEIGVIVESTPIGSGSFMWDINATSPNVGNNFSVRVRSVSKPTVSGTSAVFTLTLPPPPPVVNKITITSPVYGAVWKRSTTHAINWKYTGNVGSTVSVYLMQSGKTSYIQLIGTKAVSSKTISWKVPSTRTPAKNYFIRVVSNTGIKADSPIFTIS